MALYDVVARAAQALAEAGCEQKLVAKYLNEVKGKPKGEALRLTGEWLNLLT